MNHALYGATIPFVIGMLIYFTRGRRAGLFLLIALPLAMAFMATWASVPDIPRALGFNSLYHHLESSPWCDIFLWHYTLDQVENSPEWYSALERDSSWFAVGIALEAAAILAMAIKELFRSNKPQIQD